MKILICGSRDWNDIESIANRFETIENDSIIIHGACRGADLIAEQVAIALGMKTMSFPADWNKHGRSAGPKRNQQMLDEGKPDLVIAFHNDIENSRGTLDMITRAKKNGVPVEIISE